MPHSAQRIRQLKAIFSRYKRSPRKIFNTWPDRPAINPPPHGKQHYSNLFVSRKGHSDFTRQVWRQPNQILHMTLDQFTKRSQRSSANAHIERVNNKLNMINNVRDATEANRRRRVKARLLMNKFRIFRRIAEDQE